MAEGRQSEELRSNFSKIPRYVRTEIPVCSVAYKKILQNVSEKKKNIEECRQKIVGMKEDLGRHRTAFGFVDQQPESQTSRKIIFTPGGTKRKGTCVNAFTKTLLALLYLFVDLIKCVL